MINNEIHQLTASIKDKINRRISQARITSFNGLNQSTFCFSKSIG